MKQGACPAKLVRAFTSAIALCIVLVSSHAFALTDVQAVVACDQSDQTTILNSQSSNAGLSAFRSAIWLNRSSIAWPNVPVPNASNGSRFVLYSSAKSAIIAKIGEPVVGNDLVLETKLQEKFSDILEKSFAYLESGVRLTLTERDEVLLKKLHRQQLVLAQIDATNKVERATELQPAAALDDLYSADENSPPLGLSFEPKAKLSVWAPTANDVRVCLYRSGQSKAYAQLALSRTDLSAVWSTQAGALESDSYYNLLIDLHVPGVGQVINRVTDPYSVSLSLNSKRSYVADLNAGALKPRGWDSEARPNRVVSPTDMVIYELHLRDFSIGDQTMPRQHRGKYLAFEQTQSDAVKHLHGLSNAGITDLHLLPVFDLATVPEAGCTTPNIAGLPAAQRTGASQTPQAMVAQAKSSDCFNWGYDPFHYTSPEGSYASDADNGATRVLEFRRMVMALHHLNLRVGMDVVYNHTSASGQDAHSVLDQIVPGYYQRLNSKGEIENSTCCANTATEHKMMARLMRDSVAVWANHYHIDSFRFDLMGHQPKREMLRLQQTVNEAAQRRIDLIGEGWNYGEVANNRRFEQASQTMLNDTGIASFSDRARDAVRGGGCCDSGPPAVQAKGFVNWPGAQVPKPEVLRLTDLVRVGLAGTIKNFKLATPDASIRPLKSIDYAGQPAGYASEPAEVVNYVENHDNQTLFDINVFKLPLDSSNATRVKVQLLALAVPALSQGIAYFHAGGELLRSKSLDRNSFDSGDWFNRIDYTGRTHGFASGLPIQEVNGVDWPLMKERLELSAIKIGGKEVFETRDRFFELLKVRASSTLFRLRSAKDIEQRLKFYADGPDAIPGLIVASVDGRGYFGANFSTIAYAFNSSDQTQRTVVPEFANRKFVLHPALLADRAAQTASGGSYLSTDGHLVLPARSVLVWVER
jgi:pullulanase